jgi:hypothetical protein
MEARVECDQIHPCRLVLGQRDKLAQETGEEYEWIFPKGFRVSI